MTPIVTAIVEPWGSVASNLIANGIESIDFWGKTIFAWSANLCATVVPFPQYSPKCLYVANGLTTQSTAASNTQGGGGATSFQRTTKLSRETAVCDAYVIQASSSSEIDIHTKLKAAEQRLLCLADLTPHTQKRIGTANPRNPNPSSIAQPAPLVEWRRVTSSPGVYLAVQSGQGKKK